MKTQWSCSIGQLKRKHNYIAYHRNRECVAARTVTVGKVDTDDNVADLGTKVLALTKKNLLAMVM